MATRHDDYTNNIDEKKKDLVSRENIIVYSLGTWISTFSEYVDMRKMDLDTTSYHKLHNNKLPKIWENTEKGPINYVIQMKQTSKR